MTPFATIVETIEDAATSPDARAGAAALLAQGELILENWIAGREETPTHATKEGFRLLALHRQGASGDPSFNACRETCRELVYHYNLIHGTPDHPENAHRLKMAGMIARHLCLFVKGKMEENSLGEFCCSSRPLHTRADTKEFPTHG